MRKLSYWNIVHFLAVGICSMRFVLATGADTISLSIPSLLTLVGLSYVLQLLFYVRTQEEKQRKIGVFEVTYILYSGFRIPDFLSILSLQPLYALVFVGAFVGLLVSNPTIYKGFSNIGTWWDSLPAE